MVTLFLVDSPYIDSGSNLFKTATFFFLQGGCQLNMLTATLENAIHIKMLGDIRNNLP